MVFAIFSIVTVLIFKALFEDGPMSRPGVGLSAAELALPASAQASPAFPWRQALRTESTAQGITGRTRHGGQDAVFDLGHSSPPAPVSGLATMLIMFGDDPWRSDVALLWWNMSEAIIDLCL